MKCFDSITESITHGCQVVFDRDHYAGINRNRVFAESPYAACSGNETDRATDAEQRTGFAFFKVHHGNDREAMFAGQLR